MQVSEKEGALAPVWNQALSFLRTRILRTACEVGLSLIFFGPEPVHVPFGTKRKHIICGKLDPHATISLFVSSSLFIYQICCSFNYHEQNLAQYCSLEIVLKHCVCQDNPLMKTNHQTGFFGGYITKM